ncbi:ribosomal maturation YjgA family protein [Nonlabens marinus]|uniref:ribosomal maturation YjgA family protein n=1 Tax=Nonlabens marinus TaxID=930802 RepID=UPI0005A2ED57|nr:DUF2809 domain-containing protein [Nonlabens marinus]
MHRKSQATYVLGTLVFFLIEVFIAVYVFDDIVRPYLGDLLVVILLYCFTMAITHLRIITALTIVLCFSFVVEFLQGIQLIEMLGWQNSRLARTIIGTSFSYWDLLMYTAGALLILSIEWFISTRKA